MKAKHFLNKKLVGNILLVAKIKKKKSIAMIALKPRPFFSAS